MQEKAANHLDAKKRVIAEAAAERQFKQHPELEARYGAKGHEKCVQDTEYHCKYLVEAVRFDDEALFLDYVAWAKVLLFSIGVEEADLQNNLSMLSATVRETLPEESNEAATRYIESAIRQLPRMARVVEPFVKTDAPHGELAERFLNYLLAGGGRMARELIFKAIESGVPPPDIYNNVFVPCLHEVGRMWQTRKINEAQEHFCTERIQTILGVLSTRFEPSSSQRTALGFCVASEEHQLGIRLALDGFQLHGWNTVCLGADVPTNNVGSILLTWEPDVVLVAATMSYHLAEVRRVIEAIREAPVSIKPVVIAGGRPFDVSPELWRKVGADLPGGAITEAIRLAQTI